MNSWTTSGVSWYHLPWKYAGSNDIRRNMLSSPLKCTHDWTTSGVACPYGPYAAHTVRWRRAWNAIFTIGKHTRSDDVGRDMQSLPSKSTHSGTTTCMESHHCPYTAYTVGLRQALHAIMDFFQDTWSDNVGRGNAFIALGMYTWSDDVGHDMLSSPFKSTHNRTTTGMAYPHGSLVAQMVRWRWAWHVIIAIRQHIQSEVAYHHSIRQHTQLDDVRRDMPSSPLDNTHGGMTSGV